MQKADLEQALDESTPTERLQELVEEVYQKKFLGNNADAICKAVAQNPNASKELLKKLFRPYPEIVLNNPVIDLLILENPNFINELFESVGTNVYYESEDLFSLDRWAASHQSKLVRIGVTKLWGVNEHILEGLAKDSEIEVRLAIANSINTPRTILNQLLQDRSEPIRLAAQQNLDSRNNWYNNF